MIQEGNKELFSKEYRQWDRVNVALEEIPVYDNFTNTEDQLFVPLFLSCNQWVGPIASKNLK